MLHGDDLEAETKFAQTHGVPWRLATADSVRALIEDNLAIQKYPTYILLDREGVVLSFNGVGELPLRGDGLVGTLEKLLLKR